MKTKVSNGTLYIVATPIGNAEDLSSRARHILSQADIVAAEDTRTTQKLFSILDIKNKTVSNHKFNEKSKADYLLSELEKGKNIALVSDAGTPCISDPGGVIVKAALEKDIQVVGIPGASAIITALSICGFCFNSFTFYGFLPRNGGEIKNTIKNAGNREDDVSIFFESPRRIKKSLEIFAEQVPDADLCLCNDLTKLYERIYRGKPCAILEELLVNPSAEKGEYTLVASLKARPKMDLKETMSPEAMLIDYMAKSKGSIKDAVKTLAEKYKADFTKKDFYNASLNLRSMLSGR